MLSEQQARSAALNCLSRIGNPVTVEVPESLLSGLAGSAEQQWREVVKFFQSGVRRCTGKAFSVYEGLDERSGHSSAKT